MFHIVWSAGGNSSTIFGINGKNAETTHPKHGKSGMIPEKASQKPLFG